MARPGAPRGSGSRMLEVLRAHTEREVQQAERYTANLKFREKTQERDRRGGGKFLGSSSLVLALILNQSFLFLRRCTLRQGPKIGLGMFQALSSVVSRYHTIPLQEPYC